MCFFACLIMRDISEIKKSVILWILISIFVSLFALYDTVGYWCKEVAGSQFINPAPAPLLVMIRIFSARPKLLQYFPNNASILCLLQYCQPAELCPIYSDRF